jgi:Tfp pilus assembly protein PilV
MHPNPSRILFRAGAIAPAPRRGFTLLEVMTGMMCFMVVGLGVAAGVMQAQRLSQLNILRTTAYTVAQGYMEQMLSINPANLESASEPWVSSRPPIPTESVNSLSVNTTNIETSDPLYVSPMSTVPTGANLTPRTDAGYTGDMWNNKSVMVDLETSGNVTVPVVMNMQLDVMVSRAWTEVNGMWQIPQSPTAAGYFLIRIDFQFESNGYLAAGWQKGSIRMARNDVAGP